jgi:OOP family OmpA-OmpF porin
VLNLQKSEHTDRGTDINLSIREHSMSKSRFHLIGAALAASLVFPSAAALAVPDNSYIGVLGSGTRLDSKREADDRDGYGGAILYGRQFSERWLWELQLSYEQFDRDVGSNFRRYGIGGDLQYALGDRTGWITPYALIGGGIVDNDNPAIGGRDRDSNAYVNAGLGLVVPLFRPSWPRLRAEVRYVNDLLDFTDNGFRDWRANVGLEFPLSRVMPEPEPVPPAPEPEVRVVEVERVVEVRPPYIQRLDGVHFELDSARLRPDSISILEVVAADLLEIEPQSVEVRGHTCDLGSAAHNLGLSERRAQAVLDFLVEKGVPANILTAEGFGEESPLRPNDSPRNRELNRRVELRITE